MEVPVNIIDGNSISAAEAICNSHPTEVKGSSSNLIKVDFQNKANDGLLTACIVEFLQVPFTQSILGDIKRGRELHQDSMALVDDIADQVAVAVYYIFKEAVDGTN